MLNVRCSHVDKDKAALTNCLWLGIWALLSIKSPLILADESDGAGSAKFAVDVWIPAFQTSWAQI